MSYDGDIQPDGACAMAESLIATALRLKAVASGGRAKDGVDADASTLQPQDKQTAAPVRRYAASSRSPQHIGQVLPYTFMPSLTFLTTQPCQNLSDGPVALLRAAGNDSLPDCRGAGRNRKQDGNDQQRSDCVHEHGDGGREFEIAAVSDDSLERRG